MSIDVYSETPASNDLANYFQTGMAPSKVKNAGWDIMADLASRFAGMHTSAGTANAQTVTQTRQWAALVNGLELIFLPGNANTGAVTLAVDGLTAKNIFVGGSACQGGELSTTVPALVKYDGTQFNLLNPVRNTNQDYAATAGTNTITATIPGLTAYYNGLRVKLKLANTSTASVTVNLNSIGAVNVYVDQGGLTRDVAGMLVQNGIAEFVYDSSFNSAAGGFQLINPSRVTGSFTITLTGMTAGTTGTVNYAIEQNGKTVLIRVNAAILGTSNTTAMTGTGVPAALSSTTAGTTTCATRDATTNNGNCSCQYGTTTWTFGNQPYSAAFTASGSKGLPVGTFSYNLD